MITVSYAYLFFFLTCASLAAFGVLLNQMVMVVDKRGLEGWTWALVVVGVGVTVAASGGIIGWRNVLVLLVLFAASGTPMIVGAVWRNHQRIQRFIRRAIAYYSAPPSASADAGTESANGADTRD